MTRQINYHVVIADPASFKRENESLSQTMENRLKVGLSFQNPTVPNSYSKNIVFVRDDQPCPKRVLLSVDAFRPVILRGDTVEVADGFDAATVLPKVTYVDGFIEGCNMGIASHIEDEFQKSRKR